LGACCIGLQESVQPEFQPRNNNNQRAKNATSTSYNTDAPVWHLDSGATDHLTSDIARLHLQECYGGMDHVQAANGAGLSIVHIGHSSLAGSSIHLKNILHVPRLSTHVLSVNRLCGDIDICIVFHRHFFCVKDKATRKIQLHGRSQGGLYPIPRSRASSSLPRCTLSGVTALPFQWHQRLGHPTNNVVQSIVKTHALSCAPFDTLMTHKYRGCIIVLSINKSVESNEEQKVLTSGFDQGFTVNTSKQVFRSI
jgi:hypothetical protein